MEPFRYTRQDRILALILTILILIAGAATLTSGLPNWGDDSAAYLSEGIAIADGNFLQQTKLNNILHPADLPPEAASENLVYVWGYPLLLSAVYRLVGFDRVSYASVIWYKIPLLLSLSLLGGVLYLFYRRRFSAGVSFVCACLLCLSSDLVRNLNYLYSDLPFLFFSMLAFLTMELFRERAMFPENRKTGGAVILGVLYGAVLWYTHETRLNGMTVCIAAALGHAVFLWRNRKRITRKELWIHALPYAVMALLILVSERLLLAPATSNLSVVGNAPRNMVRKNILLYRKQITDFFSGLPGFGGKYTAGLIFLACLAGMALKSFPENLHLTILLLGTLIVTATMTFYQGLRYLYNILPVFVMFAAYGFRAAWRLAAARVPLPRRLGTVFRLCAAAAVLCLPFVRTVSAGAENIRHWGETDESDVYSAQAIDMYRYIQEYVPEDRVIAFGKPRSLYLNTERVSFRTGYNGHRIEQADYYLEYRTDNSQFSREQEEAAATSKEIRYSNGLFTLYKVIPGESEG